jgi:hypothetical protein
MKFGVFTYLHSILLGKESLNLANMAGKGIVKQHRAMTSRLMDDGLKKIT